MRSLLALVLVACNVAVPMSATDMTAVEARDMDTRDMACRTNKIDWNAEDGGVCCGRVGDHCCSDDASCNPGLVCQLGWTSECAPTD